MEETPNTPPSSSSPLRPQDSPGQEGASTDASLGAVFSRLGPAAWLGVAWAVLPFFAGITLLTRMKPVSDRLIELAGHGGADLWKSLSAYVVGFVVLSGAGLLPTFAISVLGGFAFGVPVGFGAALAGFGGASVVGYFIARTVARDKIEQEIVRHPRAGVVRDSLVGSGFWKTLMIVTLVRVPPNSPFALMNGTLATTGVRLPAYVIGTLVGMAPRTLAYVVIGSQVTDWAKPERPKWMLIAGIGVTVAVILVIGSMANRALRRVTGEGA